MKRSIAKMSNLVFYVHPERERTLDSNSPWRLLTSAEWARDGWFDFSLPFPPPPHPPIIQYNVWRKIRKKVLFFRQIGDLEVLPLYIGNGGRSKDFSLLFFFFGDRWRGQQEKLWSPFSFSKYISLLSLNSFLIRRQFDIGGGEEERWEHLEKCFQKIRLFSPWQAVQKNCPQFLRDRI